MFGVGAIELYLSSQWNAIGKPACYTLINREFGRVNGIIHKFKDKVIACVLDGEVFVENLKQSLLFALLRWGFQLEELLERLQLNFEEVWVFERMLYSRKAYSIGIRDSFHCLFVNKEEQAGAGLLSVMLFSQWVVEPLLCSKDQELHPSMGRVLDRKYLLHRPRKFTSIQLQHLLLQGLL